jgi:hypothetical protein
MPLANAKRLYTIDVAPSQLAPTEITAFKQSRPDVSINEVPRADEDKF